MLFASEHAIDEGRRAWAATESSMEGDEDTGPREPPQRAGMAHPICCNRGQRLRNYVWGDS